MSSTNTAPLTYSDFALPARVATRLDVAHLLAEMERVDQAMTSTAIRTKTGSGSRDEVTVGAALTEFLELNKLMIDASRDRTNLVKQLKLLKDNVPVIHLTFATEADTESLQQLASWVRSSLHPQAVISVGLQPGLVAGVYVRTPNKVHDFSMRSLLEKQRSVLVGELEALRGAK